MLNQCAAIDRKIAGCRSAGRNLKSFEQISHRRVESPCEDLQSDNSRRAHATFNVREVSLVHVEMDGEIICAWPLLVRNRLIRPPNFRSKQCSPSARLSYGPVFMRERGHSRNVFVNCVLSRNLWQPGEPCKLLKTLNIYGLKGHCSTN
jgi:hypothetical protein